MASAFDFIIHGSDLQLVEIVLNPTGAIRAEAGTMTFMESGIDMETTTGGGLLHGFKRAVTGESFFITTFSNRTINQRSVGFAAPYPGKIIRVQLGEAQTGYLCQKDAFLCADVNIEIEVALTKRLGAGLLGAETALFFSQQGKTVTIIEMLGADDVLKDASLINRDYLLDRLSEQKVRIATGEKMETITGMHRKVSILKDGPGRSIQTSAFRS